MDKKMGDWDVDFVPKRINALFALVASFDSAKFFCPMGELSVGMRHSFQQAFELEEFRWSVAVFKYQSIVSFLHMNIA